MAVMTAADCQLVTQRCVKLREDATTTKFILSPVSSCCKLTLPAVGDISSR